MDGPMPPNARHHVNQANGSGSCRLPEDHRGQNPEGRRLGKDRPSREAMPDHDEWKRLTGNDA